MNFLVGFASPDLTNGRSRNTISSAGFAVTIGAKKNALNLGVCESASEVSHLELIDLDTKLIFAMIRLYLCTFHAIHTSKHCLCKSL